MKVLLYALRAGCLVLPWIYMPTWPAVAATAAFVASNVLASLVWVNTVRAALVKAKARHG